MSTSSSFFRKLNANQRVWGAIGAVIVTGTVFKVAYFRYCREIMIEQADKTHLTATAHLQEAQEFAKWSAQDRAAKRAELPPLTPQQQAQMKQYLRMMQEYHAFNPDSDILDPETGKPR